MKRKITIFPILFALFSCSTNSYYSKEIYIKVIIPGDALTPNAYNKGMGVKYYSYFNFSTDSLVYLYPEYREIDDQLSYVNHGFQGKLDNSNFRDTLIQLIHALDRRNVGSVSIIEEGSRYCGWEYYVEYKVGTDLKYYCVTAGVNDTLDRFFDFFQNLQNYDWRKVPVDPQIVNIDKEVVAAFKRYGSYDSLEIPYPFPLCDSEIDFTKLVGRWRTVGNDHRSTRRDWFYSYTLNADRTFAIQKYSNRQPFREIRKDWLKIFRTA
jgi:hypothetical protein